MSQLLHMQDNYFDTTVYIQLYFSGVQKTHLYIDHFDNPDANLSFILGSNNRKIIPISTVSIDLRQVWRLKLFSNRSEKYTTDMMEAVK